MAKRNRGQNRGHVQHLPQSLPAQSATASLPPVETETDKRQNRRISLTLAGTVASVVLNLGLAVVAVYSAISADRSAGAAAEANKLAQVAQDRAAGKVQARFELVPEKERDPKNVKDFMRKQDGYENQVFRIESVDELVRWGPRISIRNTGTEPIDAIKTDIHYEFGAAYGVGVQQISPSPILLNEATIYESSNFGKLMPGQTAKLDLSSLLLDQITRLKWPDFSDKDHVGVFSVNVSCRLVGSTSYDRMDSKQPVVLHFHWRPSGFKHDAKGVKDLLAFKPSVQVE